MYDYRKQYRNSGQKSVSYSSNNYCFALNSFETNTIRKSNRSNRTQIDSNKENTRIGYNERMPTL